MVYFIQGELTKLIKIGYSGDPESRLKELQVGSPDRLNIICKIPGPQYMERKLQQHFRKDRLHGEWFKASIELINFIREPYRIIPTVEKPRLIIRKSKIVEKIYNESQVAEIKLGFNLSSCAKEYTGPLTSLL